jgi:hypothetical protein
VTDILAAALFDVQAGNLLIAAGLRRQEVATQADAGLLLETQRQIEITRQTLMGPAAVPSGFDATLNVSSATIDSAIGGFRSYSDKLLGEIVSEARSTIGLALDKLGKLDVSALGDLLSRLGESLPFAPAVGALVRRGVEMVKKAIEALAALFGEEMLTKMREEVGEVWRGAGALGNALFEKLLGVAAVKARIKELGYLIDSSTHYILCMSVLAGTGSRFNACSTSR